MTARVVKIIVGISAFVLAIPMAFVILLVVMAEFEVSSSSYSTYAEAERGGLVAKGWIPSYLPTSASDIQEAHDIDANEHCLSAKVDPSQLQRLPSTLELHGFSAHVGSVPPPPGLSLLRSCPFDRSQASAAPVVLRRKVPHSAEFEYVSLDHKRSTLLYWTARQ